MIENLALRNAQPDHYATDSTDVPLRRSLRTALARLLAPFVPLAPTTSACSEEARC